MSNHQISNIPYVESRYKGGNQKPTVIILAPSFTTSEDGAALGLATTWNSSSSPYRTSHYVVDNESIYRCTDDNVVAGRPRFSYKNALRITICAEPVSVSRFWDVNEHSKVLYKTASLVSDLSQIHNIRLRYLNEVDQRKWNKFKWRRRGGIILEVRNGWPEEFFLNAVEID